MVAEIRIYFEGDRRLRRGFHEFLHELIDAARRQQVRIELIPGEAHPIRDFMMALRTYPLAWNVLLLDCEGPFEHCSLDRLRGRRDWAPPAGIGVGEDQVFRMVQLMESWFLADKEALAGYFGKGFSPRLLPRNPNVERIRKSDVKEGLKAATRRSRKGPYHKTRHAPDLLSHLNPELVKAACPNCRRLFDELRRKLQ